MKKILLYTDTPLVGGAEKHLHLLAKYLKKDGYNPLVVCSAYASLDEWCEKMAKDGLDVQRIKVLHKHDPRHLGALKKIIQQEQPDLLHLHLWNPGACRYAFMAPTKKTIKTASGKQKIFYPPIVCTEHDPFPLKGLKKALKIKNLKKTEHTIAVSKKNAEQMAEWYPKQIENNISVIHNGIELGSFEHDLQHLTQQEKQKIKKQQFEADPTTQIIITIATLHPRKGLQYLIEAFAKVQQEHPNTRLIIVGDGPEKKQLEVKIKKLNLEKNVKLLGQQQQVAKLLKTSDLFVLPSVKEAFGLVLIEAMAAQLPIVATKVGGIPEIIEDKKNGLLAEPANAEDLAAKINIMLNNKALAQKMAFLGTHKVKIFDIKQMVSETEKTYENILKENSQKADQ